MISDFPAVLQNAHPVPVGQGQRVQSKPLPLTVAAFTAALFASAGLTLAFQRMVMPVLGSAPGVWD